MHYQHRLLFRALNRNKAHVRSAHRFTDRFGVVAVVLLALAIRHDELGRHDAGVVTHRCERARQLVGARARFHSYAARRQLRDQLEQLAARETSAQHGLAACVDAMHTQNVLCQINPNRRNLAHDCLS